MIAIFKYGAKEMATTVGYTRSRMRMITTSEYQTYLTTGETTGVYGYDRSVKWQDSEGNKLTETKDGQTIQGVYNSRAAKLCTDYAEQMKKWDMLILESSKTGSADFVSIDNGNTNDLLSGDYVNLYMGNGFGTMFKVYDRQK